MQEQDNFGLYAPAAGRVAAAVGVSLLALVLPRTSSVKWWALAPALALLALAGAVAMWRERRTRDGRSWPVPLFVGHVVVANTGAGFVGVAVGGTEGNQRFVLMAILVFTASSADGAAAVFGWVVATFTVYWSAVLGGTPANVAVTVSAMFAVSAAAIGAIVHSVLTNQRAQARLASATAALASSIACGDTLEDLPDVLPLASDVLGGPSLRVLSIGAERSPVEIAAFDRPLATNARGRSRHIREAGIEEQVLITTSHGEAYVLVVNWPSGAARRAVPPRTVGVVRDLLSHLVERSKRITVLEHHTMTDPLTGLGNRRALADWMQRRSAEATVVILDLDHFKRFNDSRGHLEGDALLRRFASVLQAYLREEDCAVRLGGEEFCIALDRADALVAERYTQRVRASFALDPGRVTFSAGVAGVLNLETVEDVLNRADQALYEAKRSGRDRTVRALVPGRQ